MRMHIQNACKQSGLLSATHAVDHRRQGQEQLQHFLMTAAAITELPVARELKGQTPGDAYRWLDPGALKINTRGAPVALSGRRLQRSGYALVADWPHAAAASVIFWSLEGVLSSRSR